MICEYCGGEVSPKKAFKEWIDGECENCRVPYAFREDKEFHTQTLRAIFGNDFNAVMMLYKKRIQELMEDAEI